MEVRGRDGFVGVDWALQTHHVFVIDAQGRKLGERGFAHGGEGLAEMAAWIEKHTGLSNDIRNPYGGATENPSTPAILTPRPEPARVSL